MNANLPAIAQQLKDTNKKVQLIYAFNGTGKTRLSREFKQLVAPKDYDIDEPQDFSQTKVLYYSAFTEDLFYWDNDLDFDKNPILKIQRNSFTDWVLKEQGQDQNITTNFQHYSRDKLTPYFNEAYDAVDADGRPVKVAQYSEVKFVYESGDDDRSDSLKISKGEESMFVWSVFYTLLEQVVAVLNDRDPEESDEAEFSNLEYVFIDDPVSSLDENHLIELAVNLARLIRSAPGDLKFIVTTHNPLFFNVMYNEINSKKCYLLERLEEGTFELIEKDGESNRSFSYHLHLKQLIDNAINEGKVEKYHFVLIRNLYEKTASFLGYKKWTDLLKTMPGDEDAYLKRILTFSSHRTFSNEEMAEPTEPEKQSVKLLLDNLVKNYGFWKPEVEKND